MAPTFQQLVLMMKMQSQRFESAVATPALICALLALLVACSPENASETDRPQPPGQERPQAADVEQAKAEESVTTTDAQDAQADPVTLRDVDASFEVLANRIAAYSASEKEQALNAVRTELRVVDARIDALAMRAQLEADELSKEMQAQREATIRKLRERRSSVETWVDTMRKDSVEAWSEVQQGFARAYLELGESFARARDAFED